MSEWIINVEFTTPIRRCGAVECETEEEALAVSVAYRDKIIAEEVIPKATITVRRNMAEQYGQDMKAPPAPPTPPTPKATKRGRS